MQIQEVFNGLGLLGDALVALYFTERFFSGDVFKDGRIKRIDL